MRVSVFTTLDLSNYIASRNVFSRADIIMLIPTAGAITPPPNLAHPALLSEE
jgi:hypothetical protein